MKAVMRIVHIELMKKAPNLMGIMKRPDFDMFRVTCIPNSLMESQQWGWEQINKLHLEQHADKLAESYGEDYEVFTCILPMTRHTVETNGYEPGSLITLQVTKEMVTTGIK